MAVDAKCPIVKSKKIGDVDYNQQQMEEFRYCWLSDNFYYEKYDFLRW